MDERREHHRPRQQFTAGFDAEQRERYLPAMARGECLGAFAMSEPEAGSDIAN